MQQNFAPHFAGAFRNASTMTAHTYLFMDFDGVTHPWGGVEDFRSLPLIESVLRDYEEVRVVIASDWRMLFSLPRLKRRFSEDIRLRIAGVTPHLMPGRDGELQGLREREAMAWLAHNAQSAQQPAWCALDDAPGNWPTRSRLVLTDFKRGFTDEDAEALRRMLSVLRGSAPLSPSSHLVSLWG